MARRKRKPEQSAPTLLDLCKEAGLTSLNDINFVVGLTSGLKAVDAYAMSYPTKTENRGSLAVLASRKAQEFSIQSALYTINSEIEGGGNINQTAHKYLHFLKERVYHDGRPNPYATK